MEKIDILLIVAALLNFSFAAAASDFNLLNSGGINFAVGGFVCGHLYFKFIGSKIPQR